MDPPLTAPLRATPPLRLSIVGRTRAGKSTLARHLLSSAPTQPAWPRADAPPSPPSTSKPPPVLARLLRSTIGTSLRRVGRAVARLASAVHQRPSCDELTFFPVADDPEPLRIWDARGERGVAAVAGDVDVVLFVTRLDDTRVAKADKIALCNLLWTFGPDVFDRIVLVLTHGCALPPPQMTFEDVVRGRADLLMRYVDEIFPPEPIEGTEAEVGNADDESAEQVEGAAQGDSEAQDPDELEALRAKRLHQDATHFREPVEQEDSDPGENTMDMPEDIVNVLFKRYGPFDNSTFEDARKLPFVVVEQSHACERDENGLKTLPDGSAWLPMLIDTIADVAKKSREKKAALAAQRERERAEDELALANEQNNRAERRSRFWKKIRKMLNSFSTDGFRVLFAEFAVFVLVAQLGSALNSIEKRRKERMADDEDVILQLSEKEWEKLTKPDAEDNSTFRISDDEDDDITDPEAEFFGSRDKSESVESERGMKEKGSVKLKKERESDKAARERSDRAVKEKDTDKSAKGKDSNRTSNGKNESDKPSEKSNSTKLSKETQ